MNQTGQHGVRFNYVLGLINFVIIFCAVWLLWYVFMNPNGMMKLYTPMYGFALVVILLSSVVLMTNVMDFYPFSAEPARGGGRIGKGILLTIVSLILMLFINYVVFWNFIGRFGIAYFSPDMIVAAGGTGAEPLVARESACTAIVYFMTAFLWMALTWSIGFGRWPWLTTSRGVLGWSRLFAVYTFTTIVYVLLFHPHVCYLFYPAQSKAGVAQWWASFAGTGSAFFSLGLILCVLSWLVISDLLWEGYPWKVLERDGQGTFGKGVLAIIVTLILGIISCVIMLKVMNYYWMEPFEGGQYTDAPYFRYLHTGEISGFFILAAFILATYFNRFPNTGSLALNAVIRTIIVILAGLGLRYFYYSAGATYILGKVPGIANPDDTSLVWTILFLAVVMIQRDFFASWPLATTEETASIDR